MSSRFYKTNGNTDEAMTIRELQDSLSSSYDYFPILFEGTLKATCDEAFNPADPNDVCISFILISE